MFAGIGGFHLAFNQVCQNQNIKTECVLVSEIDKSAKLVYSQNFNYDTNQIVNIKAIDNMTVEQFDWLFAGFPCQPFSNAGNKQGFDDEIRGTLFFEIVKILQKHQPKYILLENVKYITSHNNGNTWKTIYQKLTELGYLVPDYPLILSPHQFGIRQERYRAFIPGVLKRKISNNSKEQLINHLQKLVLANHSKHDYQLDDFLETNVAKKII